MQYVKRGITEILVKGIQTMPVIFINGPRQTGKSTLAHKISTQLEDTQYISFDDPSVFSMASFDPEGFLNNISKTIIIDEVQLVPSIFRQIKAVIDKGRLAGKNMNGSFILTGSTNIMSIPNLSEALVGRVQLLSLLPFSASETVGNGFNFINTIFTYKNFRNFTEVKTQNFENILCSATFPQLSLDKNINKSYWIEDYINTLLFRDVRNISQIEKLQELPRLLRIIASRVGGLLNEASLARATGFNQMTLRRYRALLHGIFLVFSVPAWHGNIGKRMVKAPKDYLVDTQMLLHLLGFESLAASNKSAISGFILENFVATELKKQITLFPNMHLYHFRTTDNKEIDFIIEKNNGDILALEVKSSKIVKDDDFKHIKILAAILNKRFIKGIVLYKGNKILHFEKNMLALPIDLLWSDFEKII